MPPSVAAPNFAAFWPFYLRAHSKPWTRRIHVAGTILALVLIILSLFCGPFLAIAGVIVGYGFAWVAHFVVEGNRPATFGHPLWSLRGDLTMTLLFLSGRLDEDLRRHLQGDF